MQEIIDSYLSQYLPRRDILHRLPVSIPISKFWPELQRARKERAEELPLVSATGETFGWVLTENIVAQSEDILSLSRRDLPLDGQEYHDAMADALIDEAIYSSVIEGAFTTKQEAKEFINDGRPPKNKSEQMVKNNYEALTYVLEHIDEPITSKTIFDIFAHVTKDTLERSVPTDAYRSEAVYVQSARGDIIHTAPPADKVTAMMDALIGFIQTSELPPLIKACVAHFYFVYVHPFEDGNGRTARALSYMILLQAGYDFFRYFSISGVIAEERAKYYKAIKDVEDDDFDMTYFIDYYTGMLARALARMKERLFDKATLEQTLKRLEAEGANARLISGAEWILTSGKATITIKAWQDKYNVALETARQDLFKLEEFGILRRKIVKRKYVFEIILV